LTHIKVDYGSFQATEVEPVSIPDMLAERPIIIFGKYKGTPSGTITVTGQTGKKNYKQTFQLSKVKPDANYAAIRYLWARERIKLLDYMENSGGYYSRNTDDKDSSVKQITELGLKYNLMTNYTSFIAIDEQIVLKDGKLITVKQPIPLPEGVSDYAVGFDAGTVSGVRSMSNKFIQTEVLSDELEIELEDTEEEDHSIYLLVDEAPEFPGGEKARDKFITSNMVLNTMRLKDDVTYRVVIAFVVEIDGSISQAKIGQSSGLKEFDEDALRVVKSMPKWTPGKRHGKYVRTYYSLPVSFTNKK
jgi:Ca-activated chloride channel family protein